MNDIEKAIKGARAAQRGRIYGSFSNVQEVMADEDSIRKGEECGIEKARSGIYADTAENRKLNRVGQQYGSKKDEKTPEKNNKNSLDSYASETSTDTLKKVISSDKADNKLKEAAKKELEKRGNDDKEKDVSKQKSESGKHLELRESLKKESNRVLMNITNDKKAPDYMRAMAKEEFERRNKKGDDKRDVKINNAIEELIEGSMALHTLWDDTFEPDEDVSENSKRWVDAQRDYYENDKNGKAFVDDVNHYVKKFGEKEFLPKFKEKMLEDKEMSKKELNVLLSYVDKK